jgi:hypothetical protein
MTTTVTARETRVIDAPGRDGLALVPVASPVGAAAAGDSAAAPSRIEQAVEELTELVAEWYPHSTSAPRLAERDWRNLAVLLRAVTA